MNTFAPTAPIAAALWDFDGTLVDSEPVWVRAQYALTGRIGVQWTATDAERLVGNALIDSGRYMVQVFDSQLGPDHGWTPEAVLEALVEQVSTELAAGEIPWRPGARELLEEFRAAGIPTALVSASYRQVLDSVLTRLPEGTFTTVVAGEDTEKGKPDPAPYLLAAQRLGVDITDCVVFEDSLPGTASGNAAGATVIGIQHLVILPEHPNRVVIHTLSGVDIARVAALVAGAEVG